MNRLHPLSAVVYALQYGFVWLWIPVFLVVVLSGVFDPIRAAWMPLFALAGLAFGLVYGVAYYYRFGYQVTEDTFDVASGVFARRSREIPYGRIQNVDIRQGVVQRLIGLAIVSIETAGGGDTEASLNFVSEAEATRLQNEIRRRTAGAKNRRRRRTERPMADTPDDEADLIGPRRPPEMRRDDAMSDPDLESLGPGTGAGDSVAHWETPTETFAEPRRQRLFDLDSRELLLYSFTSFRPAAVAAVLFIFFLATDTIVEFFLTVAQPVGGPADLETGTTGSYGVLTIVSLINGIVITYLLSVAYTFATYYDFRLGRIDEDFVYERGLLQRYSGSVPSEKVQSVTVTDNPAQRLIGYAGLWVETAGYGPDSNGGSQSAVPLARRDRVYSFTENLTDVETPAFRSPPTLARRRYLVRYGLVAAGIVAVAFGFTQVTIFDRWYLAAIVFAAVPVAAHLRYVNLEYYVGDEHLVIRRGFWRRRTTIIPYYRIQTVSTRRSIFQRRLGLASLIVDTASSQSFSWTAPTIYDVDLEDARDVHQTSRNRLQSALRERADADDHGLSVDFT
ncbi:PH domain-containing protein [Natrarchaeobaculum sulfurireducens]|uniref:YdbS-like PH domain-containing protein n=1 Tax=Natrarchaeobaculum sulfurireducens TaxID=2044521 RepID=A0A346PQW7_9EURY|nr:PH domain-containing protein [Natrarchaeobaculum sulfurireducens]AXR78099.1 hypothetical protein AArc1_1775 [Natrarchaeobaculum sulfurireducens]AXR81912.1 hypothetical protein AArcMg_1905 [Natrarchaeobaculum sulfurireducens]